MFSPVQEGGTCWQWIRHFLGQPLQTKWFPFEIFLSPFFRQRHTTHREIRHFDFWVTVTRNKFICKLTAIFNFPVLCDCPFYFHPIIGKLLLTTCRCRVCIAAKFSKSIPHYLLCSNVTSVYVTAYAPVFLYQINTHKYENTNLSNGWIHF